VEEKSLGEVYLEEMHVDEGSNVNPHDNNLQQQRPGDTSRE
jgi:hypothetical protein